MTGLHCRPFTPERARPIASDSSTPPEGTTLPAGGLAPGEDAAGGATATAVRGSRRLIAVLSAANFAIGLGAFVVIGVLNPIADSYAITPAEAGWAMTAYAIAYAFGSPLSVALTGALPRRRVLIGGLSLFAVGALCSALAPGPAWLYAARVLAALGAGVVTPLAASIAIAASGPGEQGRALARVFLGLTLAQVIGVPVGSWIGYTFGWPVAFHLVAALTLASVAGVVHVVPRELAFQVNGLGTLGAALADWRSVLSVLFTASFIGAIYILYTYLAPLLSTTMDYGRDGVSLILFAFGAGAVIGNVLGGRLSDRFGPYATLAFACGAQILFLPLFSLLPFPGALLLSLTVVWSACCWSFMVAQQARLVAQTPGRQSVVLALNAASIYVGAAAGSALGALVIDTAGLGALGVAAGAFSVLALLHLIASERLARRAPPAGG